MESSSPSLGSPGTASEAQACTWLAQGLTQHPKSQPHVLQLGAVTVGFPLIPEAFSSHLPRKSFPMMSEEISHHQTAVASPLSEPE